MVTFQLCSTYLYIAIGKYGLVIRLNRSTNKYEGLGSWYIVEHFINNGKYYHVLNPSTLVSYKYLWWNIPIHAQPISWEEL